LVGGWVLVGDRLLRWRPRRRVIITADEVTVDGTRLTPSEASRQLRLTDPGASATLRVLAEMTPAARQRLAVEALHAIVRHVGDDQVAFELAAWAMVDGGLSGPEGPTWHVELDGVEVVHSWFDGRSVVGEPERGRRREDTLLVEVPTGFDDSGRRAFLTPRLDLLKARS
jgi:hypothetical protein